MEKAFAQVLKELREAAGLSQIELAQKSGLTGSYICILEGGRKPPPSDKVIKRFARVLKANEAELLGIAHLERTPVDIREKVKELTRRQIAARSKSSLVAEISSPFELGFSPGISGQSLFKRGLTRGRLGGKTPAIPEGPLLPVFTRVPDGDTPKIPKTQEWKKVSAEIWRPYRYCFRVTEDERMSPRLETNDILIVDSHLPAQNGDLVIAKYEGDTLVRKYYELDRDNFELLAVNPDWPPIRLRKKQKSLIKGVVIEIIRSLR